MILTAIASAGLVYWILPETMSLRGEEFSRNGVMGAIVVGLIVGALMSIITEYYTAMGKRPVNSIIEKSGTGHATNVIGGLAIGMESTFLPILVLAGGIWGSYAFAGLYGVAIAAAGMMATTAMQLAIDAFGPIADNAGGIAEMSELPSDVREKTDVLDAVGNTTAATGKGFAIASAALTALALFAAFVGVAGIDGIDIYKAKVLASVFVGAMIPFIFSSLAISAVGQAAMAMVAEVRRQFKNIPGIMEGTGKPEYDKCVAISTEASLKKMMLPGAIAIVSPLIMGFLLGPEALGGFLAGATVSGVLMGMFQNNAGGAWDNAKKSFEKGVEINGVTHKKGSEPHKAAVTGDTVGDPFKDTSGPSMNILIKLMSIVSLVIAPTLKTMFQESIDTDRKSRIQKLMNFGTKEAAAAVSTTEILNGGNTTSTEITAAPVVVAGTLNADGDFLYDAGANEDIVLPDNSTITAGKNSFENQFVKFVAGTDTVSKEKWFTLDNIYFETGKNVLKQSSKTQLENLAKILKLYPNVNIKFGGYTDNTGDSTANVKLSQQRAEAAQATLAGLGIDNGRLAAEGYGSQHPVCPANDSDACKAQNRRVSLRVTKK
jgi:K(+)-stimulated pyrophosphate-energized sodium pump